MHPSNSPFLAEATVIKIKNNIIKSSYYPVPLNPLNLKVNEYCHPVPHPPKNKLLVTEQSKIIKYNKPLKTKPCKQSKIGFYSCQNNNKGA